MSNRQTCNGTKCHHSKQHDKFHRKPIKVNDVTIFISEEETKITSIQKVDFHLDLSLVIKEERKFILFERSRNPNGDDEEKNISYCSFLTKSFDSSLCY